MRLPHPPGSSVENRPEPMMSPPYPGAGSADLRVWWLTDSQEEGTAGVPSRSKKVFIDGGDRMKRRFSDQQLYELRNSIRIDWLIRSQLLIPCKVSEGFFRFLCPLCGEFGTATHAKTNLARCFRCEKNFNTIDMVMLCRNLSFVESVEFLKACQNKPATSGNDARSSNPRQMPTRGRSNC